MPGLLCEIKKGSTAASHVQNPSQAFFSGKPQGSQELRAIRRIIVYVFKLAIERFITREPGIKEGKITPLATIQLHGILFMNLSPSVRGKLMAQLLPKLP